MWCINNNDFSWCSHLIGQDMLTACLWCCSTFIGGFAWCWWGPWFSTHFVRHAYRAPSHIHTWWSSDGCIQTAAPSRAALCDYARWAANQKQLNSSGTTSTATTTPEWPTSLPFSCSLILLKQNTVCEDVGRVSDAARCTFFPPAWSVSEHEILEILLWVVCVGGEAT